jgi:hypothetical protein
MNFKKRALDGLFSRSRASAPLMALALLGASLLGADRAEASGGYFVQQTETSLASGHLIALSISPGQTTLYDQLRWNGSPSSFAWVLPSKGLVEVALSSDALFQNLAAVTKTVVSPPPLDCPMGCGGGGGGGGGGGSGGGSGGVAVLAQETVGPYEMVQLSSSDPSALYDWLLTHGYVVPADIKPVIDAYSAQGFNFLALRLVPGQGLNAMRPVRVTTPGAFPGLPLRMTAAGAGAVTPITLWIFGEGRYKPANFPSFEVNPASVVWDWGTQSSNYAALRQAALTASNGQGWLVEMAEPFAKASFEALLLDLATSQPAQSGYAVGGGDAIAECQADLDALFSSIPSSNLWVTRLYGELAKSALVTDLTAALAASQVAVPREVAVSNGNTVGMPPACPCGQGGAGGQGSSSSQSSSSQSSSSGAGGGSGQSSSQSSSSGTGGDSGQSSSSGAGGAGAPGEHGGCGCVVVGGPTGSSDEISPRAEPRPIGAIGALVAFALAFLRRKKRSDLA